MNMYIIQKDILPINWIEKVLDFNIQTSSLNQNNKIISEKLIKYIEQEKEVALTNHLVYLLVRYIIFKDNFLENAYEDIPLNLLKEVLSEIGKAKGLDFTRKVDSIFVELLTYQFLIKEGYSISNYTRSEGSADLIMQKNDNEYNFEVKFKENIDTFKNRLFSYINSNPNC